MRLEFDSDTLSLPFNEVEAFENSVADGATQAQEFLRAGIKAAQSGNRAEARQYLLRVTETEPDNENAWLWLASISEYPEELLIFLNNVLEVNPTNERALEWLKATNSLLAVTFVERGINAANAERNVFAKQCFFQAVAYDAKNEMAWLWLAFVSDSTEEKRSHLDKVLRINPANKEANNALKEVHTETAKALLRKALAAFADDRRPAANEMLDEVLQKCPELTDAWLLKSHLTENPREKIECFEKILEINPAHETAKANLNSLLALMKNAEPETESENVRTQSVESAVVEEEFSRENQLQEPSFIKTPEINNSEQESAREFESAQDSAANGNFAAEKETELHQTKEAVDFEEIPASEEAPFADEAQSGEEEFCLLADSDISEVEYETDAELTENRIEETEDGFVFHTASEEAVTASYNSAQEETGAVESSFQTEESVETENDADEQFSQGENASSHEFENEENELLPVVLSKSEEIEEKAEEADTKEYILAADEAASPGESFQPEDGGSSNILQQENNMLEVENYHSKDNYSPEFASNKQDVPEKSVLMEIEGNEEFSSDAVRQTSPESQTESFACPFCDAENNAQSFDCETCRAVFSLSDLEMLLSNQNADTETLRLAVERMEKAKNSPGFGENELLNLGVGHINLKNMRQGFAYLQQALQANPNDVLLSSQVNALAIRLEEIERHDEIHDTMPKNRKILVVDDSATVRKLISGKLEKSGHEVFCAVDGMDALEKLNEVMPDLILLDINMPRMDGYQVCKLIRNNPLTKDIPVVMISGKDGFFDKVRGRMAGTTGYITKPFGPETLMKALDVYIKGNGENLFFEEETEASIEV